MSAGRAASRTWTGCGWSTSRSNQDRANTGPGERIILFHFDTYGGVDGVDFKLLGSSFCVELIANGQEVPGETRLGQAQVRPDQLPVCFQR